MIARRGRAFANLPEDWLPRAVTSGFFATAFTTVVLLIAYWMAAVIGTPNPSAPLLLRWVWGLAYNPVTSEVETYLPLAILLHFLAGIGWAVVYGAVVEPNLTGPGWRKGMLFSLLPWALSLVVLLPLLGGGFLALGLGAGPLPILGNLILHLVYGASLGLLYLPVSDVSLSERGEAASAEELMALVRAGRTMAIGIVVGMALGGLLGWILAAAFFPGLAPFVAILFGAVLGAAIGVLVGSFWGLAPENR